MQITFLTVLSINLYFISLQIEKVILYHLSIKLIKNLICIFVRLLFVTIDFKFDSLFIYLTLLRNKFVIQAI